MAKKDDHTDPFLQMFNEMKDMFQGMNEEQREEIKRLFHNRTSMIELENKKFYSYQKPDYKSKSTHVIRWLGPFWNAQNDDDKVLLCKFVESDIRNQGVTQESLKEEIRGYLYHVFDTFDPDQHENHWRLYGPFWIMEKQQMTDCLDLVLESLRQDAFFFHNYFIGFSEWISAVVYQLGKNQIDTLEQFIYEQGIMPDAKPIVFNALVWIYLQHPEKKLQITSIILKFLDHCLDICKKGASPFNIEDYAIACVTAEIKETLPILRQLFTELHFPTRTITGGYEELEQLMNNKNHQFCCLYDNMNDFLYDEEELFQLDEADFPASGEAEDDEEDDDPFDYIDDDDFCDDDDDFCDDDSIYYEEEKAKRYIVHIELQDAPEKVERTLQVPSNIYLTSFTELLMLAFGRQDVPEQYEYNDGDLRYRSDIDDFVLEEEYWEMEDPYYTTLSEILRKKGNTATFNIMKGNKTIWRHVLTLEKSGRYTEKTEHRISLNDGQGYYPIKSIKNMDEHIARYNAGKLRRPNLDTIRKRIRNFEEDHETVF